MRPKWKQVVVSFLIGALIGATVGWGGTQWIMHQRAKQDPYERLLDRFNTRLDLTEAQRIEVARILDVNRESIKTLRAEVGPRFKGIRAATQQEIREQLTPEQQQTFDTMQEEWDTLRKKRR